MDLHVQGTCAALADPHCGVCHGRGVELLAWLGRQSLSVVRCNRRPDPQTQVCRCVARSVFRAVHYRVQREQAGYARLTVRRGSWCCSYPQIDYRVDFEWAARRSLTRRQRALFRLRYHLGADWQSCAARYGWSRRMVFYHMHAIEAAVGRGLLAAQVFPLDRYRLHDGTVYEWRQVRAEVFRLKAA